MYVLALLGAFHHPLKLAACMCTYMHVLCRILFIKYIYMSQSACTNLTLCQRNYAYLCDNVVRIAYALLEASAVRIREVCGCTPIRV